MRHLVLLLALLLFALASCAPVHRDLVLPIVGAAVSSAGRVASTTLDLGLADRISTAEGCLAAVAVADLAPVGGRVLATRGAEYPAVLPSVDRCIARFGLQLANVPPQVGQHIAALLDDVRPLVEAASRRCDVGARWGGLLTWLGGVAPVAVHLARTGEALPVPAVRVDFGACGDTPEVERALTRASARASLALARL